MDTPNAGLVEDSALEAEVRQFVTFVSGDEVFAADMVPVREMIRVPDVVRVPLSPPSLLGLANLRGRALPILSLRRVFGLPDRPLDDASRAMVIDLGEPMGFVVDRVTSVVAVETNRIEDVGGLQSAVHTELLSGVIKDVGAHPMVMILDFARLLLREFAGVVHQATPGGVRAAKVERDEDVHNDDLQLVSFTVAGQEYAVAIDHVQEIVQVPDKIAKIPRAELHVLGIMNLRNRLLPLVSLRSLFELPTRDADDRSRILVLSVQGLSVGVLTDSVNEVLRVSKSQVEPMSPMLVGGPSQADIAEVCRLDNGRRLVSIVQAESLFRRAAVEAAMKALQPVTATSERSESDEELMLEDEEQFVIYRLGTEEFGASLDKVQEIVRVPEQLTRVPSAPTYVEGVINLRASVLAVIDMRRRLGLPSVDRSDRQRIMVFVFRGLRIGFIVDAVSEVLKLPRAAIEAAPRLFGARAHIVDRIANLQKQRRLIQLIDVEGLVEAADEPAVAALGRA